MPRHGHVVQEQDTENVRRQDYSQTPPYNHTNTQQTMSPLKIFFLKLSFYFVLGDSTPSPSSYTLPPLLGPKIANKFSSASYSMTARAKTGGFAEDLAKTPGPGNYRTVDPAVYKKKDPAYSMNQRSYMPGGIPLSRHIIFIKI